MSAQQVAEAAATAAGKQATEFAKAAGKPVADVAADAGKAALQAAVVAGLISMRQCQGSSCGSWSRNSLSAVETGSRHIPSIAADASGNASLAANMTRQWAGQAAAAAAGVEAHRPQS